MTVRLPYIVDPVKSLTKKHRDNNNLKQAKVVYISQCRKLEDMKSAMCIVHAELVSRKFMIKLIDMSVDDQQFMVNTMFQHFDCLKGELHYYSNKVGGRPYMHRSEPDPGKG